MQFRRLSSLISLTFLSLVFALSFSIALAQVPPPPAGEGDSSGGSTGSGLIAVTGDPASYFPIRLNLAWLFTNDSTYRMINMTDRIVKMSLDPVPIAVFESYAFSFRTFVNKDGKVSELMSDGGERLWYDFTAPVGSTWTIEPTAGTEGDDLMDGTTVEVKGTDATVSVPYGTFDHVYHFVFTPRPGIADAGLLEEWFAPGVGCIKRVMQSIAGPITHELVELTAFEEPQPPPILVTVETDKETYTPDEPIVIKVIASNIGEQELTLQFNDSYQADYLIDWSYRWGEGQAFLQVLTSVTIPPGGTHAWSFTHTPDQARLLPGVHMVTGEVVGYAMSEPRTIVIQGEGGIGTLSGTVTAPDGSPLAEAYIALSPLLRPEQDETVTNGSILLPPFTDLSAMTDDQGRFRIENIPTGVTYGISVYKDGYLPAFRKVEITTAGETGIKIALIPIGERYDNTIANVIDGIQYEIGVDKFQYMPDETIQILYRITNVEDKVVVFRLASSQRYEFTLLNADGWEAWRWSANKRFDGSPGDISLAYGESIEFRETLDLSTLTPPFGGPAAIAAYLPLSEESPVQKDATYIYVKFFVFPEDTGEPGIIRGLVTGETGVLEVFTPLAGAKVIIRPAYYPFLFGDPVVRDGIIVERPTPLPPLLFEVMTTETDAGGNFEIKGPPIGSFVEVVVFKDGYEPGIQTLLVAAENDLRFALPKARFENVTWVQTERMLYELSTDRLFYFPGEMVIIRYRATNTSKESVSLTFPSGQTHDFALLDPVGETLWRWSDGKAFTEAMTTVTLDPGQSIEYEEKLDLKKDLVGTFLLKGWLPLVPSDLPGLRPEETELAVKLGIYAEAPVDIIIGQDGEVIVMDGASPVDLVVRSTEAAKTGGKFTTIVSKQNTYNEVPEHIFVKLVAIYADPSILLTARTITIQIGYTDEEITAIRLSESDLKLFILDETTKTWQPLPNRVDTERNVVWGETAVLNGTFAVFAGLPSGVPTAVEDEGASTLVPSTYALHQNLPNPFNPITVIPFDLPRTSNVTLSIYDLLGRRVRLLLDGEVSPAGRHEVTWDGRDDRGHDVASGVYLYRLTVDGGAEQGGSFTATKRMILVR